MYASKYSAKSLVIRCLAIIIGVVITGVGAGCFVTANLGSDPVTAFVQGLSKATGLDDFGMTMNIFNVFFLLLMLVLSYKLVLNIGTLIYTLGLGFVSNFFIEIIGGMIGPAPSLLVRIITLAVGAIAVGVGLGLYQSAELGAGPSDAFNQYMVECTGLKRWLERIIFDAIMIIGALIMGGTIHVGTLVGMFLVGPIMAPIMKHGARLLQKWTNTAPNIEIEETK